MRRVGDLHDTLVLKCAKMTDAVTIHAVAVTMEVASSRAYILFFSQLPVCRVPCVFAGVDIGGHVLRCPRSCAQASFIHKSPFAFRILNLWISSYAVQSHCGCSLQELKAKDTAACKPRWHMARCTQ